MRIEQHTLKAPIQCSGTGLHSGNRVNLFIRPAPANHGIKFVRTDISHRPIIHAHFRQVIDTSLATTIGSEGVIISTIEHLMAAFSGMEIDNAVVEIDSFEVPIMDGSSEPFVSLFKSAGIKAQGSKRQFFVIRDGIEVWDGNKSVGVYPSNSFKITYTIDFSHPMLAEQTLSVPIEHKTFETEIGPARTFGFLNEVDLLKRNGFALGGSLENAVVIGDGELIMNKEGLRFQDEFVRHKILDFVGDLSLLGMPIIGHLIAYKSGHALNHALLEKVIKETRAWETTTSPFDEQKGF
ncbi:MAG: UDP-3-O-acyl-N-acetylglucosamine deacetylase [Pseudomonadota bacterium]